jgi:hypothetical protein
MKPVSKKENWSKTGFKKPVMRNRLSYLKKTGKETGYEKPVVVVITGFQLYIKPVITRMVLNRFLLQSTGCYCSKPVITFTSLKPDFIDKPVFIPENRFPCHNQFCTERPVFYTDRPVLNRKTGFLLTDAVLNRFLLQSTGCYCSKPVITFTSLKPDFIDKPVFILENRFPCHNQFLRKDRFFTLTDRFSNRKTGFLLTDSGYNRIL